ncbi:MAG: 2-C-methyl-D-erythritol 2,4-cyclodiphosphate synthase [candidate division Zixibacteria bacterium]
MSDYRIGNGFDVHAFAKDRKLILGGIEIEYELGLSGHSDADVLVHAVIDALLGAVGLGDIGRHYPDSDETYRNIDSMFLLEDTVLKVKSGGWSISNVDATVIAQRPKLSEYIDQMRERLAGVLQIDNSRVNVKATTTEKLGFTGREEGIAALATAAVYKAI